MQKICLLLLLAPLCAFAQSDSIHAKKSSFYLRGGLGMANGYGGEIASGTTSVLNTRSYTAGANGTLAAGYMFTPHIGVELAATALSAGSKINLSSTVAIDSMWEGQTVNRYLSSFVLAMPGLVMQTGTDRLHLYTRFALALPLSDHIYSDVSLSPASSSGFYSTQSIKIKSFFSVGFSAACGASYSLTNKLSVWAEGSALSLALYDKQTNITASTRNGQNNLSSYTPAELSTSYSFKGTAPVAETSSRPFSNAGILAGVSLRLSGGPQSEWRTMHKKMWYVTGGVGYSIPFANAATPNGNLKVQFTNSAQTSSIYSFDDKKGSFTAGLNAIGGLGCMFSNYFGIELDAHSSIINSRYNYTTSYYDDQGNELGSIVSVNHAEYTLLIMPSIVLQTGGRVQNLYCRLGIVLPATDKNISNASGNYPGIATSVDEYSSFFTPGYTAALGYKYRLAPTLHAWVELNILCFQPYVKADDLKNATANGATQSTNTIFPYSLHYTDPNNPPSSTQPYSSAGMKVGITVDLTKK